MKKLTAIALGAMLVIGSVIPVSAETRSTTVEVTIDPAYEVTIPAYAYLEKGEQAASLGSIILNNAVLEPGTSVNISVDASGQLKNRKDISKTIAYRLMSGDDEFTSESYSTSGSSTELTLSIDGSEWDKANAGTYADTLRFVISYR